jgi:hypothetical protein
MLGVPPEMRELKLGQIGRQPLPAQERDVPRQHDVLPSIGGARS